MSLSITTKKFCLQIMLMEYRPALMKKMNEPEDVERFSTKLKDTAYYDLLWFDIVTRKFYVYDHITKDFGELQADIYDLIPTLGYERFVVYHNIHSLRTSLSDLTRLTNIDGITLLTPTVMSGVKAMQAQFHSSFFAASSKRELFRLIFRLVDAYEQPGTKRVVANIVNALEIFRIENLEDLLYD